MAISSRRLAAIISSFAASIYFFIIILHVPLFSKEVGAGTCRTPLELTCCQLMASEIFFPSLAVKALLYPGAVADAFIYNNPIPKFHHLQLSNCPKLFDYRPQIEVIAGCYLCVAGSMISTILKPGRIMTLYGTLIILWGLKRDHFLGRDLEEDHHQLLPTFWFALLLSFLSIKRDVRALIRCFRI